MFGNICSVDAFTRIHLSHVSPRGGGLPSTSYRSTYASTFLHFYTLNTLRNCRLQYPQTSLPLRNQINSFQTPHSSLYVYSMAPTKSQMTAPLQAPKSSFSFHPQIPPTAERLGPVSYQPMNQHGEDNNIQSRPCPQCSIVQRTQVHRTTEYAPEQQDPEPFGVSSLSLTLLSRITIKER